MSLKQDQMPGGASGFSYRKRWIAFGCAIIFLAVWIFLLCDGCSPEFWWDNSLFVAFLSVASLVVLGPAYLIYFGIAVRFLRRRTLSIAAGRRWLLGLPVLLLIGAVLYSANRARPTVKIRWVTQGKTVKSIHSVHAAHLSTMMSDRRIAWFQINSEELRGLIGQHQLAMTNGVDLRGLLTSDQFIGQTTIPDRIPSFHNPVCYARRGSDEYQHFFSVFVLTNPNHDAAVWYTAYDR